MTVDLHMCGRSETDVPPDGALEPIISKLQEGSKFVITVIIIKIFISIMLRIIIIIICNKNTSSAMHM